MFTPALAAASPRTAIVPGTLTNSTSKSYAIYRSFRSEFRTYSSPPKGAPISVRLEVACTAGLHDEVSGANSRPDITACGRTTRSVQCHTKVEFG